MAKYTFIRLRDGAATGEVGARLRAVCELLTPVDLEGECPHLIVEWPGCPHTYLAVQNAPARPPIADGKHLIIGRINEVGAEAGSTPSPTSDGSYAIIRTDPSGTSFYTDQFGSRTLWYYLDERMLVVSTSQRAVVRLKGCFKLNREALSWFLSSGCQGPFMSWDEDVKQAEPRYEYVFDSSRWLLHQREKEGMDLPAPSTERFDRYLHFYEDYSAAAFSGIATQEEPARKLLLPLSGGLDSRLLWSLAQLRGIDDRVDLVNWGVPSDARLFDDKAAAKRIAAFYGERLLDAGLPAAPQDHDQVLDRFVEAGDSRVDHFNAYTDAFAMWTRFYRAGYRTVVRGDIPFTEGIDLDENAARAHIGLNAFSDYANLDDFDLTGLPDLQRSIGIQREKDESLIRWRDRLYVSWRVPMVISAFADLVNGYVETRSPMMSWRLYSRYSGLPDGKKGNKNHIRTLAKAHDRSGVPFHATPALLPLAAAFDGAARRAYLRTYLAEQCDREHFPESMTASVLAHIGTDVGHSTDGNPVTGFLGSAISQLSDRMPGLVKGYLKARRPRRLAPMTLAHRVILADKAIKRYQAAAA